MTEVRNVLESDSEAITSIYNHYITHTTVTFEEVAVSAHEIADRVAATTQSYPWMVIENDGTVIGYAYGSQFRGRAAYRFTVETTIYLRDGFAGQGYGRRLYGELLQRLASQGFRSAIGVIALPNPASVGLHERLGFRQVALLQGVGRKFGQWIDTGYWQLVLSSLGSD